MGRGKRREPGPGVDTNTDAAASGTLSYVTAQGNAWLFAVSTLLAAGCYLSTPLDPGDDEPFASDRETDDDDDGPFTSDAGTARDGAAPLTDATETAQDDAAPLTYDAETETCSPGFEGCEVTLSIVLAPPGPSCTGEYNRVVMIESPGCPNVAIRGAYALAGDAFEGQVVRARGDDSSFELTWDDGPVEASDCDLDISGLTSWTVARDAEALTVTVTHRITDYEAGMTNLCGYTITNHETLLLGQFDEPSTRTYEYECEP